MRTPLAILLLLLTAACGSSKPSGRSLGGPPPGFGGFPPEVLTHDVFVEACFRDNHSSLFGTNLLGKGVLPIEVHVRLAGGAQRRVLLSTERLDMRLVLQDGTVLPTLNVEDVVRRTSRSYAERLGKYAFETTLLSTDSRPGFVFFDLEAAGKSHLSGLRLTLSRDGKVRTSDLTASLLTFTGVVDDDPHTFFVGIQR